MRLLQRNHREQRQLDRSVQDPYTSRAPSAPGSSSSTRSSKVQDERHAKSDAKARVEREKSAAKRKAVSVDLSGSGSDDIFVLEDSVLCLSWSSGRAPYTVDLHFVCAWGLNLEVFAGVSLQRASIIFQYFQKTFVVRGLARLPASAFKSSVGSGLINFDSVGFPSPKKISGVASPLSS